MKKIGFIGCGNIATAMLTGLCKSEDFKNNDLYASDTDQDKLKNITSNLKINATKNNIDLVNKVNFIVLSVKPNNYIDVIKEISPHVIDKHVIITLTPGILIKDTIQMFQKAVKVVRTMPNTPSLVGEGIAAICPSELITKTEEQTVINIFNSFGKSVLLEEKHFDAFTAVCGSSPAFVYMFINALAKGGMYEGLPENIIYEIVSQAVLGSAKMVLETKELPEKLITDVSTPGGTTVVGTADLKKNKFEETVISAVIKTVERSSKKV